MEAKGSQAQAAESSIRYTPLKGSDMITPRYPLFNQQIFAQDMKMPQEKKVFPPQLPAKRPVESWFSSIIPMVHPMRTEFPNVDAENALARLKENRPTAAKKRQKKVHRESTPTQGKSKRQMKKRQPSWLTNKINSKLAPIITSGGLSEDDSTVIDLTSSTDSHQCGGCDQEQISIANVLTSLADKTAEFAVPCI